MSAKKIANFVTASVVILAALIVTAGVEASGQSKSLTLKYFKAPLRFEPNQGQSSPGIDFVAHGKGYVLHLSAHEAVFALPHEQLSMRLNGANGKAQSASLEPLQSKVNYFIGSDPSKWRTDIPTYGKAHYQNVYSGIDLVYYGNGEQLEYDFVVAPGADPRQIALDFPGARRLRTNRKGDLLIDGEYGTLRFDKPVMYQQTNGRRQKVNGKFTVSADRVQFDIGKFDHSRTLIIDPSLKFSIYLGGTALDAATAIAADNDSTLNGPHAYVTGYTTSSDLPALNAYQTTLTGNTDAFVTKLDSNGAILYSTFFGGKNYSNTEGYGIAIDASRNIYITGRTDANDLPLKGTVIQSTRLGPMGHTNAFVAEFSAAGGLLDSTYVGGSDNNIQGCQTGDQGNAITVSANGNLYLAGFTDSADFPGTHPTPRCRDAFLLGLNLNRTQPILFSEVIPDESLDSAGNASYNSGNGVALDTTATLCRPTDPTPQINVYTTGYVANGGIADPGDVFVAKFDPSGTLCYKTIVGGPAFDAGNAIAVDKIGNAYVAGSTASTTFPVTPNAIQPTFGGGRRPGDALLLKLDPAGGVSYASYLGGSSFDQATGIALDGNGNVSVAGSTSSSNFPAKNTLYQYAGGSDVFVAHFDPTMTNEDYSTFIGGTGDDFGIGLAAAQLATSATNYIFVTGCTNSADFPTTVGRTATNQTGFLTLISDTHQLLVFSTQPVNTVAGAAIPAVKVAIQDGSGNTLTTATMAVTLSIGSNPGGGTLSGTTTVNAVNGIATFSGLTIDKAGNGYTLVASANGIPPVTSASFNVTPSQIPFSNFSCGKSEGSSSYDNNANDLHLNCDFTLDPGSPGIFLATTDAFKLTVGAATISLPAGSFHNDGAQTDHFSFASKDMTGKELEIHIEPKADLKKGLTYHLELEAHGINPGSIPNGTEMTVTLTIGNNTGTIGAIF